MMHAPPYRALEALHVGRLRDSHRVIVERHLARCELCRLALASVGAYERVSGEVRAAEPSVDWDRVNANVACRIGSAQRERRIVVVAVGALALAAAAYLVPSLRATEPVVTETAALPLARHEDPAVTASTGTVRLDGAVLPASAASAARLHDGSRLRTEQGTLRVTLAPGTAFELGAATEVTLDAMRGPVALTLTQGRISSEVRPGTRYEVRAGQYVVRVRGTRFDVERKGEHVAVHLHAGRVEVIENGTSLGILVAPATWTSPDAQVPETHTEAAPTPRARTASAAVEARPAPAVTPTVTSDESDVADAMRRQSPRLARCIAPDAESVSFTIHFSVGTMGTVSDVSLSSRSEVPTGVSDCVLRAVQGFRVPAPDDPVDLSLPITLP